MSNKRHNSRVTKQICFTAIFAALCCACTLISIPIPIGYINLGDLMVLTAGWSLGGVFGGIAAGIGSALADLLLGYAMYAPATLIIKAAVAFFAAILYRIFEKLVSKKAGKLVSRLASALLAECVMVGGYFLFESVIMSYGLAAAASIPLNAVQAFIGSVGASLIISKVLFWTKINRDR